MPPESAGPGIVANAIRHGLFFPAVASAAVLLLTWRCWRRSAPPAARAWRTALALGGGYALGQALVDAWPPLPPRESLGYLWYLTLAAVFLSLFDAWRASPWWLRWPPRALLIVYLVWRLLPAAIREDGTREAIVAWVGGLGVAALAYWVLLDGLARRLPGVIVPLTLLVTTAGTADVLYHSRTGKLAQFAGALAAALVPVVLRSSTGPALAVAAGPPAVVLSGLWMAGYHLADRPPQAATLALLAAASLTGWLACLPALRRRLLPWQRALLCLAVAIGLMLAAVYLGRPTVPVPADPLDEI